MYSISAEKNMYKGKALLKQLAALAMVWSSG